MTIETPPEPADRGVPVARPEPNPAAQSAASAPSAATSATTERPSARGRTLVVGAGAIGSFLGALLGSAGHDVTLVRIFEPDSERPVELIRPDGTRVSVPVHRVTHTADAAEPDLLVVAVKMPMLRDALEPTLRWPQTPTLTVENGIGAYEIASEVRPRAPQIAGSVTAPIAPATPDEVRWLGRGGIGLAPVTPLAGPFVPDLAVAFRAAGFRAKEVADAASMKWSKLLANLVGNASGAILDMDTGAIYRDPRLCELECEQLREALRVMAALGLHPVALPGAAVPWLVRVVRLPPPLARPILLRVLSDARSGKMPSLRIHVRSAPPDGPSPEQTEVAWMNGAVAEHGSRVGIATPVNRVLATLTDEVAADPERRAYFRGRPDRLLAEVSAAPGR